MLVKLLQSEKAQIPILVKVLGNSILVKLLQPWKAYHPILVTGYSFIDETIVTSTISPSYPITLNSLLLN